MIRMEPMVSTLNEGVCEPSRTETKLDSVSVLMNDIDNEIYELLSMSNNILQYVGCLDVPRVTGMKDAESPGCLRDDLALKASRLNDIRRNLAEAMTTLGI